MVRRVCDRSFNAKSMEDCDEMEVIRGSEFRDNADQAALRFLRGGYTRLARTTADLSVKVDSMETTMDKMQRTLLHISNQLGIHPIAAETSRQSARVTYSDPYVHADRNRLPLDNRKSLMPEFDGSNVSDWLSRVERFFSVRRYSDLDKLDLVAFSLEGDVLLWFDREMTRREFHSWDEFRRRLLLKFGAAPETSSENVAAILEERASHTEKKGTVSAYVTDSEELSSQVVGLDDSHLEQIFDKGLQTEMKEVLKLKESLGLENQKKSRCLKASMFNFNRKKKRIRRWFNTLSCRESWRKPKHERLLCNLCHLRAPRGLGQLVLADLRSHMRHKWKSKHLLAVFDLQNNPPRFADGEIYVQLQESVRGCDVFLVQPTCPPANGNLMELLVMIDACRRASAKTITAVIPYFGYARADRKTHGCESIAAKLVANVITQSGADRVLACDLHSGQSMGYFDISVDYVYGQPVILDYLASKGIYSDDLVVVSPEQNSFPQLTVLSVANLLREPIWRVHDDYSLVLERTVSHEWHRWKHKTAYLQGLLEFVVFALVNSYTTVATVDKFGGLNNTRLTVLRVLCLLGTLFWRTSFKQQKFGKNWRFKFKHRLWQRECGRELLAEEVLVAETVMDDFVSLYPHFKLEDKLVFRGESIDTTDDVAEF